MKIEEKTLTNRARKLLDENFNILADEVNFEEILKQWLNDETMFNTFSKELKRCIKKASCKDEISEGEMEEFLKKALGFKELDKKEKKGLQTDIRRWLNNGKGISREYAIRICFALNLDPDSANSFLFKGCQQHGLNVRSAREAIVFFCLSYNQEAEDKYSFADVEKLYNQYEKAIKENVVAPHSFSEYHQTTQVLRAELESLSKDSFDNQTKFMDYLVENTSRFITLSKTMYRTCYDAFLNLIYAILKFEISVIWENNRTPSIDRAYRWKPLLQKLYSYASYKSNSTEYRNLNQYARLINKNDPDADAKAAEVNQKVKEDLQKILGYGDNIFRSFDAFWKKTKRECKEDPDKKKALIELFYKPSLWRYLLPGTFDAENNNTAYDSKMHQNFSRLKKEKYLLDPETIQGPTDRKTITTIDVVRKQIILMKSFELIYSAFFDTDDHINSYYTGLIDDELLKCGLYPLYPRHYFDWIIFMTFNYLKKNNAGEGSPSETLAGLHEAMAIDLDNSDFED